MIDSRKKITVGLLWHSMGSGNLGVVALTLSQIAIVRDAAEAAGVDIEFKVFGWSLDGAAPSRGGGAEVEYIGVNARALLDRRSRFRTGLSACDLVLDVGEGDSFSDIYGLKRLIYLCISKRLAGKGGRPLLLSPQTIGPFSTRRGRWLARYALQSASVVFARDPLSKEWLDRNGQLAKSQEAIDMAFRLPYRNARVRDTRIRIGLNVSGLLYSGGYDRNNGLGLTVDYRELTHRVIQWAMGIDGAEVWLVPHVRSQDIPEEDDVAVAAQLLDRYRGLKLAGPFSDPSEAKSFMSGLDFFAGGRMHACIGAFSAGVPTVPLAYSRKFNGLFAALEYPALVDCTKVTTDAAIDAIALAYHQRDELAGAITKGLELARAKLKNYEEYVEQAIRRVASYA